MRMKEKNIFSVIEQEIFFRIFLASDFITLKTALLVNFFTYFSVCIILCFTDFGFAKTVIKYSSTKNLSAVWLNETSFIQIWRSKAIIKVENVLSIRKNLYYKVK